MNAISPPPHYAVERAARLVASLSPRETEVLRLFADGNTSKMIARKFGTTDRTVETQRMGVYRKLGVNSVAMAARIAQQAGLVGDAC